MSDPLTVALHGREPGALAETVSLATPLTSSPITGREAVVAALRAYADVIGAVGGTAPNPDGYLSVFFTGSAASRQAGVELLGRITARTEDRDAMTTWQTRQAQYDAVCDWGTPDHSLLQRVSAIACPVFVANGDSDPMVLPRYSYLLAGLIPQAQVKIYPDSAHGFLFQHHAEFAGDVAAFLAAPVSRT